MIALRNTREIAKCRNLKLNSLRLFQAILAGLKSNCEVAPRRDIMRMLGDREINLGFSTDLLLDEGLIEIDDKYRYMVPKRFVSFLDSSGVGVVPMYQDRLRQFAQSDLRLGELKLFYYLLGGLQTQNTVPKFNARMVGEEIGYLQPAMWKAKTNLIKHKILVENPNSLTITKMALGVKKVV